MVRLVFLQGLRKKRRIEGESQRKKKKRKKEKKKKKVAAGVVDGLMVAGACWRWTGGSTGLQGEERS